jgi:hypothetical protein
MKRAILRTLLPLAIAFQAALPGAATAQDMRNPAAIQADMHRLFSSSKPGLSNGSVAGGMTIRAGECLPQVLDAAGAGIDRFGVAGIWKSGIAATVAAGDGGFVASLPTPNGREIHFRARFSNRSAADRFAQLANELASACARSDAARTFLVTAFENGGVRIYPPAQRSGEYLIEDPQTLQDARSSDCSLSVKRSYRGETWTTRLEFDQMLSADATGEYSLIISGGLSSAAFSGASTVMVRAPTTSLRDRIAAAMTYWIDFCSLRGENGF